MRTHKHVLVGLLLYIVSFKHSQCNIVCPSQCDCDVFKDLNRATCINHNIVDIDVGVSKYVQIYNMSFNSIAKLEDYSFMNMGYKSIEWLDLSHNMIFWIGLHTFVGLSKLSGLDLSHNRIQLLPNDIFLYTKKLTTLNLSKNKFTRIPDQPFLSHTGLEILNLSFCQISFLPENTFRELPNLIEIDLRGNYMIGLKLNVLKPILKLEYINLNENNWHCNGDFKELEAWLLNRKIEYKPQCDLKSGIIIKKFEKMQQLEQTPIENKEMDLDELWVIDEEPKNINVPMNQETDDTFLRMYNDRVPSLISLLLGFQIGIVFGILGTYCWMAKLYKCKKIQLPNRRHIRRIQRMNENEVRDQLLWNFLQDNSMTPPSTRRQITSFRRNLSHEPSNLQLTTTSLNSNNIVLSTDLSTQNTRNENNEPRSRPETPPPTYVDCLSDIVIRPSK